MAIDVRQSTNGRTERERVLGLAIQLTFGGNPVGVPPRTIEGDEDWLRLVGEQLLGAISGDDLDFSALIAIATSSTNKLIELVRAYAEIEGQTNPLPEPAWIRSHATSQEVQDAFVTLLEIAYPPLGIGRRLIPAEQRPRVIGMIADMAADYLPQMARLGRAFREAQLAGVAAASDSPSQPSTRSPSPAGATGRRRRSARR